MPRKSSTHDLQELLDQVTPKVESAIHTVAEKAPPAFEKGRAAAAEHGAQLAGALADRIPGSVVDRLPDSVVDHLPITRPRRRRKLLLLGLLAAGAGAAVVAARRGQASASPQGEHRTPTPSRAESPVVDLGVKNTPSEAAPGDADSLVDPSDPRVEPHVNTRRD